MTTVANTDWDTLEIGDVVQDASGNFGRIATLEAFEHVKSLSVNWDSGSITAYPYVQYCSLLYIGR